VFEDEPEEDHPKILDFITLVDSNFNYCEVPYGFDDISDDSVEVKIVGHIYR